MNKWENFISLISIVSVDFTRELPSSLFDVYVYLDSYGNVPDDFIAFFAVDVYWFSRNYP